MRWGVAVPLVLVVGLVLVSGCVSEVEGPAVITEEELVENGSYAVNLDPGDEIIVEVENLAGESVRVFAYREGDPENLFDEVIEDEETLSVVVEESGMHRVEIHPDDRAFVLIIIDRA